MAEAAERHYPVSFAQQRLWFLEQLSPGSPAYTIPVTLRLTTAVDVAALRRAIHEIVRRHQVLRTRFEMVDGELRQVVQSGAAIEIPVVDLAREAAEPAEIGRRIAVEAGRRFDLSSGPLIRATLFRLGHHDQLLYVGFHHTVADGWSLGIFFQELRQIYPAFVQQLPSPLPELDLQYADYAIRQREQLRGDLLDQELAYWRAQLAELPTLPLLSAVPSLSAGSGSADQGDATITRSLVIDSATAERLTALGREHGATMFMSLLAVFEVLLRRATGAGDFGIGTVMANRTREEIEGLIGCFVNTVVIRAAVEDSDTFRALLGRVRDTTLDAHSHQELPFERIVEELRPPREAGRNPLAQVLFSVHNTPPVTQLLAAPDQQGWEIDRGTANFDLTVDLWSTAEGLQSRWQGRFGAVGGAQLDQLIDQFAALAAAVAEQPDRPLTELLPAPESDRSALLAQGQGPLSDFPSTPVHLLIAQQASRSPDRVAAISETGAITYAQLQARADLLAVALRDRVERGEIVAICLPASPELGVALLGVLGAGAAFLILDPDDPAARLGRLIRQAGCRLVVTGSDLRSLLDPLPVTTLELAELADSGARSWPEPVPVTTDDLAYLIFTSGSTGAPKGVLISHGALSNHCQAVADRYALGPQDRSIQLAPLGFDVLLEELLPLWLSGASVCFPAGHGPLSLDGLTQCVRQQEISVLNIAASYWHEWVDQLERSGQRLPDSLRLVICGSERVSARKLRRWQRLAGGRVRWMNAYGVAEATITATTYEPPDPLPDDYPTVVPIGRPLANVHAYLLDETGDPVPPGAEGELYLGGTGVGLGYLGRPELTAQQFRSSPFDARSDGRLYRTGDLARFGPDGSLQFLGRRDAQVKVHGYRVELGEIEAQLMAYPGVSEAVVVPELGESGQDADRLVAYLVGDDLDCESPAAIAAHLRQRLPSHLVPGLLTLLPSLPRTGTGKLDHAALQTIAIDSRADQLAPRTELEAQLAKLWMQALEVSTVGVTDDFFALGGHSLLAMRLLSAIQAELGVEVPLRTVFDAPTVAGMAAAMETMMADLPAGGGIDRISDTGAATSPLSYAQRRLWFLDQLAPGSAFYTMPIVLRLRYRVDVAMLERTLNEIVRRHAVLRTTFGVVDGEPIQQIAADLTLRVAETDLRDLADDERDLEAQRLATAESRRPFDLARGPLIRAGLLRLGDQDSMLLLTLHHIVSDGWSLGVLFREISVLYDAYSAGRSSPLPELPIQYADYTRWQRGWLQGDVLARQLAYWTGQLRGLPELVLPTDRPAPAIATFRGARRFFTIDADIVAGVEELAKRADTTVFMVLLAAFQVLMGRYSGQTDFPVGVPIANRARRETEGLIGFFVNTLVLRADLSGDPSFRQLLARVREASLAAFEHQDLPFERLVEELHPRRDAGRSPLVQVMLALQNAPEGGIAVDGSSAGGRSPAAAPLEVVEVERGTANFDLVLDLWHQGSELGGRLEYSTELFDAARMERLLGHYQNLLAAVAARPDEPVETLPMLTEAEQQTLADWNTTDTDYPGDALLCDLFEAQVKTAPEAPALHYPEESLSYGQLSVRANQLAHQLQANGVRPGDRVAIHLAPSARHIIAMLAILKTGAVYVPLDPSYPAARLKLMIDDARPRAVLTSAELVGSLPATDATVLDLDAVAGAVAQLSTADPGMPGSAGDPAYVMYTSGSTGTPKGIVIPQRAISRLVCGTDYLQLTAADRVVQASNLSFDASTFEVWGALLNGAELVGMPKEVLLSAAACEAFLAEHAITAMFVTTAVFNQIVRERPGAFGGVETLLVGGEAADPSSMRAVLTGTPPGRLLHVYGPTECTTFATWHHLRLADVETAAVPIGRPVANTRGYVLDDYRQPVPIGVVGELWLGGPGVALGYLGLPDRTAEVFVETPWGRLYRTGDLVRMRSDLALTFVGRRDAQIKLRGHRIELEEIEAALVADSAVREAKVVLQTTREDRRIVAYVVLDPDAARRPVPGDSRVREWQQIYDEVIYDTLEQPDRGTLATFNTTGWISSYTGEPIAAEEMLEQVDQTVERVLSTAASAVTAGATGAVGSADVLEIGCGTGLLLFRLLGATRRYLATDFSRTALDYVERQLDPDAARSVTLLQRAADDFSGLADQRFDLVILNSVVQYFPSGRYLREVLDRAVAVLKPGGAIFLGDIRNLALLDAFHAAVELHRAPNTTSTAELRSRVRQQAAAERELLVAPQFLRAYAAAQPAIAGVAITPKRGRSRNELTEFRYDAVLSTVPLPLAGNSPAGRDWTAEQLTVRRVRQLLREDAPAVLRLERIPNARSERAVVALQSLDRDQPATAGELRRTLDQQPLVGVDPEELWALSDDVPYEVDLSWAGGEADGSFDATFRRRGADQAVSDLAEVSDLSGRSGPAEVLDPTGAAEFTNHPELAGSGHELIPQLRESLQQQLPDYMIPSAFVVLERLPITPNGKIDLDALPPPETGRPSLSEGYLAPRTPLEQVLADHWAVILGLDQVGVGDDFFELGGHSLLATQVVARLTDTLGYPVSLRTMFANPTVADLATALIAEAEPDYPLQRIAALVVAVDEMPEEAAAAMLADWVEPIR